MILIKKPQLLIFFLTFTVIQLCFFQLPGYCQSDKVTVKLTIIPHRSNLGNEQAYATFFSEMGKETGFDFQWVGSKTYDDVINKIKNKQADIGYVGPFAYVTANDSFGVRLICRSLSSKKVEFYHSMIVTRKDSGLKRLEDLRGKSFSFTDPKSTSGYLFPLAQLRKIGISEEDFSQVKFLKRHANSLLAVYKGHVDAGATSFTAFDKVDVNMDEIEIIWKSEPIYRGPWIARKDLPEDVFKTIQQAMLKVGAPGKNEKIFEELTTKGFIEGKDSDYDNVRDVIQWMKKE